MGVYVTSWQVARPYSHATKSKHMLGMTPKRSAMLWTVTNGQSSTRCLEARPDSSSALSACSMMLQSVQQGCRQATYASLTAFASLPRELTPLCLCLTQDVADGVTQGATQAQRLCTHAGYAHFAYLADFRIDGVRLRDHAHIT